MRRTTAEHLSGTAAAKFAIYVADATLVALVTVQLLSNPADWVAPGEPQLVTQRMVSGQSEEG